MLVPLRTIARVRLRGVPMRRRRLLVPLLAIVLLATEASTSSAAPPSVVVQKRQPVQIAFVLPSEPQIQFLIDGIRNAVQMAVQAHPVIRGYRVQLDEVSVPCLGEPAASAA